MMRLDRFLARRVLLTIIGVVLVFYGFIALSEALNTGRLARLSASRGPETALLWVLGSTARWSIMILPVTVLIGGILAVLNLQSHRELVVIKASGQSIWRIVRGPVLAVFAVSLVVALLGDAVVTRNNRSILPAQELDGSRLSIEDDVWLEQASQQGRFVVYAARAMPDRRGLEDVTIFLGPDFAGAGSAPRRIHAETARLSDGVWRLGGVTLYPANQAPQTLASYELQTTSTVADLDLKLSAMDDFTLYELAGALQAGVTDPLSRAAAQTRLWKLISLPFLLVGTLLIAFAFTAGYRRGGSYGGIVLNGIVLGFVVFVITEMADRAGSSGVLDPLLATWGPAVVAIVTGMTVLLFREDGRA